MCHGGGERAEAGDFDEASTGNGHAAPPGIAMTGATDQGASWGLGRRRLFFAPQQKRCLSSARRPKLLVPRYGPVTTRLRVVRVSRRRPINPPSFRERRSRMRMEHRKSALKWSALALGLSFALTAQAQDTTPATPTSDQEPAQRE